MYASRAGHKLAHALDTFNFSVTGLICADLGCSTGGFTDCLLKHGAAKVYSIDTGYGVLDWHLRNNPHVIVMERANALHVSLPEPVDLVTIDVGWTPQHLILPHAFSLLKPRSHIITLLKPHYEGRNAHISLEAAEKIKVEFIAKYSPLAWTMSPLVGAKAGNSEYLFLL